MSAPVLRYTRTGGGAWPPDRELLTVLDTGDFTMWRSVARATDPPSPVGSFAGRVDEPTLAALRAAPGLTSRSLRLPLDAAKELIEVGAGRLEGPNDGELPAEWSEVGGLARDLLRSLTGSPVAALALATDALRHLGPAPLRVDLSRATLHVVRWDGPRIAGRWEGPLTSPDDVVRPGWSAPLPDSGRSGVLTVELDGVSLHDGTDWVPCQLSTPSPL